MGAYLIKNILETTKDEILAVCRTPRKDEANSRVHWFGCDISTEQDVNDLNEKHLVSSKENKVFYLAAYHHPDMVEKNPRIAWDVNITSLSRFMNAIENVTKFFYPSTDSVYGDSTEGHVFVESDELKPVNRYGKHKCVAEKLVTAYGYNVVRFPFLISPSLVPEKPHFYDIIATTIKTGNPFEMFADSYRSAISFDQAAKYALKLMNMEKPIPQIVNICSDKGYSKYDVGLMIADKVGVSRDLIQAISIERSKGIFEAKRATSTLMDNTLLKHLVGEEKIELIL
jgi:Nucleoside-diphosphate-sugar epimerases